MPCPCCSAKTYESCCEPFILGSKISSTPEQLMRSRYTAFSQANIDYIEKTMKGSAAVNFDMPSVKKWAEQVKWAGLKVLKAYDSSTNQDVAFVEYMAYFQHENRDCMIHELSEFHRENSVWFYVDGIAPKVGRNDPCPCGSGKKSKQCCGGL